MSKCIPVKMSDGTTVMANVSNKTKKLHPQDVEALEQWVAMVKARHAKKKATGSDKDTNRRANHKPESELAK